MDDLISQLFSGQNPLASSGLLLVAAGGLGALLRALPAQAWAWVVNQTTMTISVKDDDAAFAWVKEWLLDQSFLSRIRRVDLDTTLRGAELALMPAPGWHFFWHAGRPFWVHVYRSEDTKGRSQRRVESLTFRTVGRNRRILKALVEEVVACNRRKTANASHLHVYDDYWTCIEGYLPRRLSSVILKPGEKEHLLEDIERFRGSRERYQMLGVPYHRGYLFYGPPGTGKTSLVSAMAAHFGMSIYAVNLIEFNDRSLKGAMNDVPQNSVILFEDIDAMRAGQRRNEGPVSVSARTETAATSGVTLSGLLNVLDGFHAPENVVFVMTTNRAEALDPALLRPGRIDYRLFLGEAAVSQKAELYRRFFPEATQAAAADFAEAHGAKTMAEFQGLLLAREQGCAWEELAGLASLADGELCR